MSTPKILVYDIETAPILGYVWKTWDTDVPINQIHKDWYVLSWGAKWYNPNNDKVMYRDQRNAKNIEDDTPLLKGIWTLLNEADIVITQNGKNFDQKKLHARFIEKGFKPPSSYKHIDTLQIAKKHFAFTSNKLEYMADRLCKKYKKLKHKEFPGFELWKECLRGNKRAWAEMEKYNKHDVLSLEELYTVLRPWDTSINQGIYTGENGTICMCGSTEFHKNGYNYTSLGKYQRFSCSKCGAEFKDRRNLYNKVIRDSFKVGVNK